MDAICHLIPSTVAEDHGYHRDCYQHFTKNIDRLKEYDPKAGTSGTTSKQRRISSHNVSLFAKDCIFCNKEGPVAYKRSGSWTTERTQKFQSDVLVENCS